MTTPSYCEFGGMGTDSVLAGGGKMVEEGLKAAGDLRVPFAPVVAAGFGVELVCEMALVEARGKAAIRFEQRFLLTGGEIDVGSYGGVDGLHEEEGIARLARLT